MKSLTITSIALSAMLLAWTSSSAQDRDHTSHGHTASADTGAAPPSTESADPATPWTEAEVRRVNPAAGKVTLRHGHIRNLDMPPMSMVFQVDDAAVLDGLKAGDKVRFVAQERQGAYWATRIERQSP